MTVSYVAKFSAIHQRLNALGVIYDDRGIVDRFYPVLDRLQLRAEGDPDCADLVGRIDEVCEREGIAQGSPVERVEALAQRCQEAADALKRQRFQCDRFRNRVHELSSERLSVLADLEAERAQLAAKATKPVATDAVKLALEILHVSHPSDVSRLSVAVLREAFA
jgi:hypothetical protein